MRKAAMNAMPVVMDMPGVFDTDGIESLIAFDHWRQEVCVGLHRVGVWVDQERLRRGIAWLEAECAELLVGLQKMAYELWGSALFNPNSPPQLRVLLYEKWGLEPPELTDTGLPSVDDGCVRTILNGQGIYKGKLDDRQRVFLMLLRRYKRLSTKWLGTTLRPMLAGSPLVGLDGRAHAMWSTQTLPGRYGCSEPNLQVVPTVLRWFLCAQPGNILGGADADQIHLRIIANLWKSERLLECFARGGDPHAEAATACFGDAFRLAPGWPEKAGGKWSGLAKKMRSIAKTLNYAVVYGAVPATILEQFLKTENDAGELIYLGKSEEEIEALRDKLVAYFGYEVGWDLECGLATENAKRVGNPFPGVPFSECALTGRRRYYFNGIEQEFNDCVNFRILAFEAAYVKLCTRDVVKACPWNVEEGHGLILDVHDSLTVEGPVRLGLTSEVACKKEALHLGGICADALSRTLPGHPAPYTASPCGGRSFAEA